MIPWRRLFGLALVALAMLGGSVQGSTISEPGFSESLVIQNSNLGNPTAIAFAPDGSNRIFVARKSGQVRIVKSGALLSTTWATMSPIYTSSECGLLGMCFDPNFLANRYVYFFVTVSATEQQIIRYVDNPATDTGSGRTVLIPNLPTTGANHDAGCVRIGPDGKLYWTVGNTNNFSGPSAVLRGEDGDVSNLCSKVGRANLDGSAPLNNPFYDGAGPNNEFVYARGLRNPFKFYFQPATGKLWVNCVGDNFEQIFVMNRGDDAGDRTRENAQGPGLITPTIKYRTNSVSSDTKTISAAVRSNSVVTFTTAAAHGYRKGENLTISGVADVSFNATFYVASTPTTTTFTVLQTSPNASSSGGTSTPLLIGTGTSAAVVGGCFYDGTLFPAQYRGNLFFGDVSSGRIIRATLDTDNTVKTVDYFASGAVQFLDITVGPDGALYYTNHNTSGTIYRVAPTLSLQNIVLSGANLRMMEGGSAIVSVSLAAPPATNVDVTVQRDSGSASISAAVGTLTFTPANYSMPQHVVLNAAADANITDDTAQFSFSAPGITAQTLQATSIDIDASSVLLSSASINVNEGQSGSFTVSLPSQPTSNVTVNVAVSGDPTASRTSAATLTFTNGNWNAPQQVTIAAATDPDIADGTATVTLSGTGLTPGTVTVHIIDTTASAPQFTSPPKTTAVVNAPYTYQATASGTPAPTFSLTTMPAGMSITPSGAVSWTPNATGQFDVTIKATNGIQPDATQNYTITVAADQPPTALISKPLADEIISGTNTEFYGNGSDDVNTVKAEFYVDGILKYTDTTPGNHYHIGGAHLLFDTTPYSNGTHLLKMIVYDTADQSGSHEISVTIRNLSVIECGAVSGTVGELFSHSVAASNDPTNYSATGLPLGLSIDQLSGVISGTPEESGTFNVTLNVTNIAGTSNNTLIVTIAPAPTPPPVVTGGNASGIVGQFFSYQIVATNSPDNYDAIGLPDGLSIDTTSGLISGTPAVSGGFNITLSATNSAGTGTAQLSLSIASPPLLPPVVTSDSASVNMRGTFNFKITATNNAYLYDALDLPLGLSVDPQTGIISGSPLQLGTFTITLSATNAAGTGTGTLTLTVVRNPADNQPPVIVSGISVNPQPLHAGEEATISVMATDADNDPLNFAWDFGDGTNSSGGTLTHVYVLPGIYPLSVSISDGLSNTPAAISLPVYPAASDTNAMAITSGVVKVEFGDGAHRNFAQLKGTLRMPQMFAPANATVAVTFGAFSRSFVLNSRGMSADRMFQMSALRKKGQAGLHKFALKLNSADMAALLPLFPNATVTGQRMDIPFTFATGGKTQLQLAGFTYTARAGHNGTAKTSKAR